MQKKAKARTTIIIAAPPTAIPIIAPNASLGLDCAAAAAWDVPVAVAADGVIVVVGDDALTVTILAKNGGVVVADVGVGVRGEPEIESTAVVCETRRGVVGIPTDRGRRFTSLAG
jgi:hypothetical protein